MDLSVFYLVKPQKITHIHHFCFRRLLTFFSQSIMLQDSLSSNWYSSSASSNYKLTARARLSETLSS